MPFAPPVTIAVFPASLGIHFSRVHDGLVAAVRVLVHSCNGTTLTTSEHGRGFFMPRDTADRLAIRDLIENWVLWRDARMWIASAPSGIRTGRCGRPGFRAPTKTSSVSARRA